MQGILVGFLTYLITYFTKKVGKKFGKKIAGQIVVVFCALLFGTVYYTINRFNPNLVNEITKFGSEAFVVSQGLYIFLNGLKK